MSETAIREILDTIDRLPEDERALLEERLARRAEEQWRQETETARRQASERGIDQAAIDAAISRARHSS